MNLDSPCSCGLTVPGEELCANLAVLWAKDTLEETEPGQGLGQGGIFRIFSGLARSRRGSGGDIQNILLISCDHRLPDLGGTLPPPP